jgi:hypothetical protein
MSLGFEGKLVLHLEVEHQYLYVCAGAEGVWRRDIRRTESNWENLGLQDTTLSRSRNVGAVDFDVLENDILVAYISPAAQAHPESTVSVWRSTNAGVGWFRSDRGIPETIDFKLETNILTGIKRSPHEPHIIMGEMESASYRSVDSGSGWSLLRGRRGIVSGTGRVRWHPFRPGEVWLFGTTGIYSPYCGAYQDYGLTPKTGVNFDSLGFPSDGEVDDMAFDCRDLDVVYASTSYGVIKSTDGGSSWLRNAIVLPDSGFVHCLANHPSRGNALYLAGGQCVYVTYDAGSKVQLLARLSRGSITSLAWDEEGNQLLIGTTDGGIYSLN